jgi:hypothetical protein
MIKPLFPLLGAFLLLPMQTSAALQGSPPPSVGPQFTYADLADLALAAPVAAHVEVQRARRLSERDATNAPAGHRRFLIEADVIALIRGTGGLPNRVSYLVDVPDDPRGRPARLRRGDAFLILASRAPASPNELRLAAPDAHVPYSPRQAERLRAILAEAARPDSAPRLTGIGRAFHVPGSLPGESETQIFLQTADDRPISLTVLRRPGERPRWAVALGEIVDDAAAPPEPETLLWYRLSCSLPRALPPQSLSDSDRASARAIQEDYRLVLERLGPCLRNRVRR